MVISDIQGPASRAMRREDWAWVAVWLTGRFETDKRPEKVHFGMVGWFMAHVVEAAVGSVSDVASLGLRVR